MSMVDQRFAEAIERLDDATAMMPVPIPPPRRHSVLVPVVAVAVAIVAGIGLVTVLRPPDSIAPAAPPVGLARGDYGTEIVMREIDDGDGNQNTITLRGDPGAGEVRITSQPGGTTAVTLPDGSQHQFPAELCIESDAGGLCGTADQFAQPELQLGPRGSDGQAFVTGVPTNVYAVTFTAGPVKHWSIPLHGIVAFPFPDTAASQATVTGLSLEGRSVFTQTASNEMLTDSEIDRAVTTRLTGNQLAQTWFAEAPDNTAWGPEVVRSEGRTSQTGFQGPFSAQSFTTPDSTDAEDWWTILTVRSDDVDAVLQRLDTLDTGRVHYTTTVANDATTLLVWAGNHVADDAIATAIATLAARPPLPDRTIDITTPRAWNSMTRSPAHAPVGTPVDVLLSDPVPATGGVKLRAQADDIGTIRYFMSNDNTTVSSVDVGGPVETPLMNLDDLVGAELQPMLLAVPAHITEATFVTDTEEVAATILRLAGPRSVTLLAVSPTRPGETIRDVNFAH